MHKRRSFCRQLRRIPGEENRPQSKDPASLDGPLTQLRRVPHPRAKTERNRWIARAAEFEGGRRHGPAWLSVVGWEAGEFELLRPVRLRLGEPVWKHPDDQFG